jgi:catechol 2,3-dioxygenase-like lactoylglutathione lyase family enzyme
MAISRLDHYSIRTAKLEETRRFYTEIVGLDDGYRPEFPFPGAWLYSAERAVVHVVGYDPNDPMVLLDYLGDTPLVGEGTGTIFLVAFVATYLPGRGQKLKRLGVPYRERGLPSFNLHQLFLEDPNGVTIELNFPTRDAEPARA